MPFKYNEISANSKGGTELVCRGLEKRLIESGNADLVEFFDIWPSRIRDIDWSRPNIYWAHDLPGDPEADILVERSEDFKALVFVSNWQYSQFMSHYKLSGANAIVIQNAIEPILGHKLSQWDTKDLGSKENPIRLIYHTTPHRGLQILVPVFDALQKVWEERGIHLVLDVYSSFSIYGWPQRDEAYEQIFQACKNHPHINYHGAVSNEEVREALTKSHIFAYPSIWQETSCIAAIEAMSANVLIVSSNLGALPETTGNLGFDYPIQNSLEANANRFFGTLSNAIELFANDVNQLKYITNMAAYRCNALYSWNSVIPQWVNTLRFLKSQVAS